MRRVHGRGLPAVFLAVLALSPAGCRRRSAGALPGDRVRLDYRVFADGKVYDTTEGGAPVELVIGNGALPAAVEAQLVGMRPGEERTITVADAYGHPSAENVSKLPRRAFSALNQPLVPGQKILGLRNNQPTEAVILAVDSAAVTVTFDHPLAGKTVSFFLRLVSIER